MIISERRGRKSGEIRFDIQRFRNKWSLAKEGKPLPKNRNSLAEFGSFWKYKLSVESLPSSHILDSRHFDETLQRLKILKKWQYFRNSDVPFEEAWEIFVKGLQKIVPLYNELRKYSLLKFKSIPEDILKEIWETPFKSPQTVMSVCKLFMFIWGQTLAFDSQIRENIPFAFGDNHAYAYTLEKWQNIMGKYSDYLNSRRDIKESFDNLALQEYGNDKIVPYGRFFDFWYWAE